MKSCGMELQLQNEVMLSGCNSKWFSVIPSKTPIPENETLWFPIYISSCWFHNFICFPMKSYVKITPLQENFNRHQPKTSIPNPRLGEFRLHRATTSPPRTGASQTCIRPATGAVPCLSRICWSWSLHLEVTWHHPLAIFGATMSCGKKNGIA